MQSFTGLFLRKRKMFALQNQILFLAAPITSIIAIINDKRKKKKEGKYEKV